MTFTLTDFVRESNRIEGIQREPTEAEIEAHIDFTMLRKPDIGDMQAFVDIVQPSAKLRDKPGMNVVIRNGRRILHRPPVGGPKVRDGLEGTLALASIHGESPYKIHQIYESLHPFMDGNGRSGRVLWLWMMGGIRNTPLGFLHHWYYQSLQDGRE